MDDFKKFLRQRMSHYGLGRQYDASLVCEAARKVSAGRFEPVSFRAGVLKVAVPTASRAHLVRMGEEEIVGEINQILKSEQVKRIRFEIRS